MRIPIATYRFQFNPNFRFANARAIVPYLHRLGVSDVYASPLFAARTGSTHGYDIIDPSRLNPALGTEAEFEALAQELRAHDMGLLLDIVPNHMAATPENLWWADVLENGPASPYARYFDIEWQPATAEHAGQLLLPILDRPYREALEHGDLSLALDEQGLCFRYHDTRLPLDPTSYRAVLKPILHDPRPDHPAVEDLTRLIEAIERLPDRTQTSTSLIHTRHADAEAIKQELQRLYREHADIRQLLDETLGAMNGVAGDSESFSQMDRLLDRQAYRLEFWRTGTQELNYRRFFDVNDLAGMRVEDPEVFAATHALIVRLVNEGKATGLRVDHIDGLHDPMEYLERLRDQAPDLYVVVEKVLSGDEALPEAWPVAGTTGYDFLNALNGVFVDRRGLEALSKTYTRFTGMGAPFADIVYEQKRRVVKELFAGELRRLASALHLLAENDLSPAELEEAIAEVAACFPIYRTYVHHFNVGQRDRRTIEHALDEAKRRNPTVQGAAFDLLRRVLLLEAPEGQRDASLLFVMRWQQFTGPAMAKGLEDTACYVYNRLVSMNEVGVDPAGAGAVALETFHRRNQERLQQWPHTMNATATHDTKRGEDARARINVLSELSEEWDACLERWSELNQGKKRLVNGVSAPDPNEELLLYQTLIGAWPLDEAEVPGFTDRLKAYVVKAAREAKVHTSWLDPNAEYESALTQFVDAILTPAKGNEFLLDFRRFQRETAFYGALNSLAQVVLKVASPGVPDVYQGAELWDLSLVDPDNRRPVDFTARISLLEGLNRDEANGLIPLVQELLSHWEDGRLKLYVTAKALGFRKANAELFSQGGYLPLQASGASDEQVIAFTRRKDNEWALIATPRLMSKRAPAGQPPVGRDVWGDSVLSIPGDAPLRWTNVLTGETIDATGSNGASVLPLHSLFSHLPVALLSGNREGQ